jgi:IS605 OrfB family transposase
MEEKKLPVTIKLKNGFIFITFDESIVHDSLKLKDLKKNRVMGIDLNPNYIGFSILEFKEDESFITIKKGVFDVTLLNKDFNKNKKRHELRELNHRLLRICKHYKVSKICVEELKISSYDKGLGKRFNKLSNNRWNREVTISNLKVLTSTHGIELVEVNPIYSSFVGNIEYGDDKTPDMVASSIEIGRRGYKKFSKGWFYPTLNLEKVRNKFNQWKEEIYSGVKNWKELFVKVKKSGMRYRFQLSECDAVFEKFYHKTKIIKYFYI